MKLDIIVNTYNDEENIEKFYNDIKEELKKIKINFIFIDNGSDDTTPEILKKLYKNDDQCVKIITFSKQFSEDAVISAGLLHSKNDLVCITDCKYKNNPTYISKMYDYLNENKNYDSICLCNKVIKNKFKIYKEKIINKLFNYNDYNGITNFRMMRRNMVNGLIEYIKNNKFNSNIFMEIGFNTYYEKTTRTSNTKNKVCSNCKTLSLITKLSLIMSFISIIGILIILIKTLVTGVKIPGYNTIMISLLLFNTLELIFICILTEYFKKNCIETNNKPLYIIKEKLGFEEEFL